MSGQKVMEPYEIIHKKEYVKDIRSSVLNYFLYTSECYFLCRVIVAQQRAENMKTTAVPFSCGGVSTHRLFKVQSAAEGITCNGVD